MNDCHIAIVLPDRESHWFYIDRYFIHADSNSLSDWTPSESPSEAYSIPGV